MKNRILFALPLIATLSLGAFAQQSTPASSQPTSSPAVNTDVQLEPLQPQTHEGFWGHLNPFARKKYVQRQLAPIRDRANELDDLTAANSRMLKDVDARATAGIQNADAHATLADQHATDAATRAQAADQTAQQASAQLHTVSQVVDNLDQYQQSSQMEIVFRPGTATLSAHAKEALDELAQSMKDQKGYIVEVQGFTPGRGMTSIQHSQKLADAVVRYLVIDHQIPVYRISELGLGNATVASANGEEEESSHAHGNRVEVTLLKNGLDSLPASSMSSPQ